MNSGKKKDIVVIGGGIVGLATALALARAGRRSIAVIEAEDRLASHQTGRNSGVIHSGLYYKPGSLKAENCVQGRLQLIEFCREREIPFDICGKVVLAVSPEEIPRLRALEERGRANGLQGLQRLGPEALAEREPRVRCLEALLVPQTGIIDFALVSEAYAREVQSLGGEIFLKSRLLKVEREGRDFILTTTAGEIRSANLVNCAGLQSDRVARLCGVDPGLRIIPFRGEYYNFRRSSEHLVKHLVYPVPDPRFPFLGVHFTRMIRGGVEAGPNAVLAFKREGYSKLSFSPRDTWDFTVYPGFWRMALKFWYTGLGEFRRSFSKRAFVKALQRMLPEVGSADLEAGGAGVRAQALEKDGFLVDDFRIRQAERQVHVLNAPSPAATASLSIGASIAAQALESFS